METEGTLSSAWDQHLAAEFAARSADEALATMTADPHVNEVPLMIGARGRAELHDFYANHFLNQIPPDMEMVPVSRTVGQGRVADEPVHRLRGVDHLRRDLPAADRQRPVEQADLDEDRGLVPVHVLVRQPIVIKLHDDHHRYLDSLASVRTPGKIQSLRIEWVNRKTISSTNLPWPMVRDTGTISVSGGIWGRKYLA